MANASKPASPSGPRGAALAETALDPAQGAAQLDQVSAAIAQLTPEEAQIFLDVLEQSLDKRRIQMWGYVAAGVALLVGMVGVFIYWGNAPEGTFVGWAVGIPFFLVGAILWSFGRWSRRVGSRPVAARPALTDPKKG
jgi:hypothetical protein